METLLEVVMDDMRYTEAQKIADCAGASTPIVFVLVRWWKEYCQEDRAAAEISFKTPKIKSFFELFDTAGVEIDNKLNDGFEEFRDNHTGIDTDNLYYYAASILIARAVAESIVDSHSSWRDIHLALIVCEYNEAFLREFEQFIIERLKSEQSRSKWVEALKRGEWEAERAVLSPNRPTVESLKVVWEREQDPFSVWDEPTGFLGIWHDSFFPVVLLFRAQLPDWVEEFERLPLPAVKHAFINSLGDEFSKKRIIELIKYASPLFVNDIWTRNTAILFAPTLCVRNATSREQVAQNALSLQPDLADIFDMLNARPGDGPVIVRCFQEWLFKHYHAALGRGQAEELQPVISAVTKVLASDAQTSVHPTWFNLLGAILVNNELATTSGGAGHPEYLYQQYLSLLINLNDDIVSILSSYSSATQLGFFSYWSGYLFTAFPSRQSKWEEAWLTLDQQREEAWYWDFEDKDPIIGSIALIESGLGCIYRQKEKNVASEELFHFWKKLLQCAVGIWVRRHGYFAESSRRVIVRCMIHATALLRDNLVDCITTFAALVGHDAELTALVALNIHANDVAPRELVSLFQQGSVDLAQSMADNMEWADLFKKKDEIELAKRCGAFIEQLNIIPQ
jgi:hypothetical protein